MSIELRFPMPISVAPDTCLQLFPQGDYSAYANVEYRIGDPAVRFVVKRCVIEEQPQSFFAVQLRHCEDMGGDVKKKEDGTVVVTLEKHQPRLYPIVFHYLNQAFASPSTASISTDGLSQQDIEAVRELLEGFLATSFRSSLLFRAKSAPFCADAVRLKANGRIVHERDPHPRSIYRVELSPEGVVTCTAGGTKVTIHLHGVPTSPPWPRSLMAASMHAKIKAGRKRTREPSAPASGCILGDALAPAPDNDDDLVLMPYPYPVDHTTSFFIPAQAIDCTLYNGTSLMCEGVYRCEEGKIRIDALDQGNAWFWLEIDEA